MDEERDYSPTDEHADDTDHAEAYAGEYTEDYEESPGEDTITAIEDADQAAELDTDNPVADDWQPDTTDVLADDQYAVVPPEPPAGDMSDEPSPLGEAERLRQPRAHAFRRRLRQQIAMLPLALALIALGVFLSARAFEVEGLPEIDDTTLALGFGGALAFTAVFHALVFGRRERGLLFFGLLVLVTAGLIYGLITFVEAEPDAAEWWPLLLAALGVTFLLTFALERGHDVRLVLLGVLTLVAAGTAYLVTSGLIEQDLLDRAADYWPLLLAALGVGLLPVAFGRRTR